MLIKPKRRYQLLAEMNVVPYIDVMLVLLVIFMITAAVLFQGINVNLPSARAKLINSRQQEPIVLSIDAKGNYYLNIAKKPYTSVSDLEIHDLVTKGLSQEAQSRQVYVKADKTIVYDKIICAMVMLQQAGVKSIGLVTELPNDVNRTIR